MSSSSSHAHPLPSTNPFYNTLKIVPSKSVPSQTLPLRSALPTFSESIPVNNFSPGWQAAQNSVLKQMVTSEFFDSPASTPIETPTRGRGGQRGRPSTARRVRGRAPKAKADSQESAGTTSDTGTPTERGTGSGRSRGRGRGRGGGRPRVRRAGGPGRGTKRKREDSDEEGDEELGKDDTDASETFTPLPAQSRSGRKISKATYFSPVAKQSTGEQPLSGSGATKGKKGQKNQQKPVQTSVCRNCGRGPSPGKNMIVYCTGCNTPWHQHCHDPPITTEVVQLEEKEWLCTDCEISREEKVQLVGKVSAEGMSLAEKRRYLQSLPTSDLVFLLLHASSLHPDLPILSAESTAAARSVPAAEETYDLYSDTDPLPYPKAGNGVPLPPEEDDIGILIDDDVETFSHRWGWENIDRNRGLGRVGALVHVGA